MLPGLEELVALAELESLCSSGRYDVVVVDCAPTAETLRLLSLPDVASWYPPPDPSDRRADLNRMVSPVLQRLTALPAANDDVFVAGERSAQRLEAVHRILADPRTTTARLGDESRPDGGRRIDGGPSLRSRCSATRSMPSSSTRRSRDTVTDQWFDRWRVDQEATIGAIEADFAPTPIRTAELSDREVRGVEALRSLGKDLWDGVDAGRPTGGPSTVAGRVDRRRHGAHHRAAPTRVRPTSRVERADDELVVGLGPHRRTLGPARGPRRDASWAPPTSTTASWS